jgi:hypothetical protein
MMRPLEQSEIEQSEKKRHKKTEKQGERKH